MSRPSSSITVRLDAGTYWICSCGSSKKLPYCDGGHQGTPFQPLVLELETPKIVEISQ